MPAPRQKSGYLVFFFFFFLFFLVELGPNIADKVSMLCPQDT
jgi:hypothetical protein